MELCEWPLYPSYQSAALGNNYHTARQNDNATATVHSKSYKNLLILTL